jgi:hypothetical protein
MPPQDSIGKPPTCSRACSSSDRHHLPQRVDRHPEEPGPDPDAGEPFGPAGRLDPPSSAQTRWNWLIYDLSPMDRSPRRIEMSARYAPFWSIPTTSTSEVCPSPVTVTCAVRGNHREVNRPPINRNLAGEPYWMVRAESVLSTTRPVLTRAAMASIAAWTEQSSLHEARRVSYEWTTTQGLSTDLDPELTATPPQLPGDAPINVKPSFGAPG